MIKKINFIIKGKVFYNLDKAEVFANLLPSYTSYNPYREWNGIGGVDTPCNVLYSRVRNVDDIELDENFKMHFIKIVNDCCGKIFIFKENPVTSFNFIGIFPQ